MPSNLTSSDSEVLDSMDTPQQETPQTCTRQTPCAMQTCFTCSSPSDSNNVLNLTTAMNTTTSTTKVPTSPAPPKNHWIPKLTRSFQDAILKEDMRELNYLNTFYNHCMVSEPDILDFDQSQLRTTLKQKITNSSIFPIPTPTPFSHTPPPSTGFKPPGIEIP